MKRSSGNASEYDELPEEVMITLILGVQALKRLTDSKTLGEHIEVTALDRDAVVQGLTNLNWLAVNAPPLNTPQNGSWTTHNWQQAAHYLRTLTPIACAVPELQGVGESVDYHSLADQQSALNHSESLISDVVSNDRAPRWQRVMLGDLLNTLASFRQQEIPATHPDYVWYRSLATMVGLQISLCQQMNRLSRFNEGDLNIPTFAGLGQPSGEHMVASAILMYGARRYQAAMTNMTSLDS